MKALPEPEPLTIVVSDLIDHGLISVPRTVFGIRSGKRIEARLTRMAHSCIAATPILRHPSQPAAQLLPS